MKYIFFDIDGTLVSHVNKSHIPDETRKAIKLLKKAGHVPAIATGRAAFLAKLTAKEFDIKNSVCSGGAQIIIEDKEIYRAYFPDEYIYKFRDVAKKFPEITAAVDDKYLYTYGKFDVFREYFNNQAGYDCIRHMSEMKRAIMCYIMLPNKILNQEHGIFFSPPAGVRLELMNGFTEARNEATTKWRGIEMFIEKIGADINDVITFGDGVNDIDMLCHAKMGVAVGRASEKVKNAADFVCDDIDEGGILKACYELDLI